jgi:hypothetical protein
VARKVERFPELPSQSRYPWESWLDGDIWELTPGEDFKGKADNFRAVAITQAKKRGGKLQSRLIRSRQKGQADKLYIQFLPGEPPAHEPHDPWDGPSDGM